MPATFTSKFSFGYGWFLGEDPGTEPLDYQTKALDALVLDAFGQDIATSAGLTYGYRGGWLYSHTSRLPFYANGGTVLLPANQVSYIQRDGDGNVSSNTTGFTVSFIPMSIVTTNNFEIVTVVDARTMNGAYPNLVSSVFGRIGDVVAINGDYVANQISLQTLLAHYPSAVNVQQALELMDTDIALALVTGVQSFSPIGGLARTGNVFTQYGDYSADIVSIVNDIPGLDLTPFINPSVQNALGVLSVRSGVSSFNTRLGDVVPVSGDYPAGFIPYNNAVTTIVLLPSGVSTGGNVQIMLDALKQHYHDATQIAMNPVIVSGKDTVQKMLQWLYDNRGTGTSGLTITTPDYSVSGTAPYSIDLTLTATGGVGPYTWVYVSGTIPGGPSNGTTLGTGHLTVSGITPAGMYYATLQVTDSTTGTHLTATATINIALSAAGAAPTITSFTASPSSGTSGSAVSLGWSVSGATSLSIDNGIGTVTGTSHTVNPTVTTTYTLTATNSHGSTTATTTETITALPPAAPVINSFTATPSSYITPGSSTLAWSVTGTGVTLTLDHAIGTVTGSSLGVTPTTTTTYTLTATNVSGSVSATTTVTVQSPPVISTFSGPSDLSTNTMIGSSGTLHYTVTGATSMTIDHGIGTVTGSSHSFNQNVGSQTYTLMATNSFGTTTRSITILRLGTINTQYVINDSDGVPISGHANECYMDVTLVNGRNGAITTRREINNNSDSSLLGSISGFYYIGTSFLYDDPITMNVTGWSSNLSGIVPSTASGNINDTTIATGVATFT